MLVLKGMKQFYFAQQLSDSFWTENQPTAEVLTKLRTFLDLPSIDDDGLFIVQKWIKLLANKLQVELGDYRLDNFPTTKRSRLGKDPEVDVVDDPEVDVVKVKSYAGEQAKSSDCE